MSKTKVKPNQKVLYVNNCKIVKKTEDTKIFVNNKNFNNKAIILTNKDLINHFSAIDSPPFEKLTVSPSSGSLVLEGIKNYKCEIMGLDSELKDGYITPYDDEL